MKHSPEYWASRGGGILKRRRDRYASDPEYAAAARERSRKYREKAKQEREIKPITLEIGGVLLPAVTMAGIAETIGISKDQLKYYHKKEYIPAALVTRPKRLYTHNQMDLIKSLSIYLSANKRALKRPDTQDGVTAHSGLAVLTATTETKWNDNGHKD